MPVKSAVAEGAVAAGGAIAGIAVFGTAWMEASVCLPLGWVIIGPLVLLFVPALAIVTAISRRLGVKIEVEDTQS